MCVCVCVCVCVFVSVCLYVLGSEYVSVYARVFICLSTPCSPPSPPDSFALLSFLPPS